MRLNLGCGGRKFPDWINVDKFPTCGPDQVVDLEQFPWPWPDNSVDEVRMYHVLEHLGAETATYLGIVKELYRVCRDNAMIHVIVPHPRHDDFLGDPTHVRVVTRESIDLLSQAANRQWLAMGAANTPLGLYIEVDFAIESTSYELADPWNRAFEQKTISDTDVNHAIRSFNNVIKQISLFIRPVKPAGRTSAVVAGAASAAETPLVPDQAAGSNAKLEPLRTT
jgi:predicted SAM-dependent methyltransferase